MNEPIEADFTVERTPSLDALARVPLYGAVVFGVAGFVGPLIVYTFGDFTYGRDPIPWGWAFGLGFDGLLVAAFLLRITIHWMGYRGPKWPWMLKYTTAFILFCMAFVIVKGKRFTPEDMRNISVAAPPPPIAQSAETMPAPR